MTEFDRRESESRLDELVANPPQSSGRVTALAWVGGVLLVISLFLGSFTIAEGVSKTNCFNAQNAGARAVAGKAYRGVEKELIDAFFESAQGKKLTKAQATALINKWHASLATADKTLQENPASTC